MLDGPVNDFRLPPVRVHDDKRAEWCDVVPPTPDLSLRRRDDDVLSDRHAQAAIVLHEEVSPPHPVPRHDVLEVAEHVLEEIVVVDVFRYLPLHARRARPDVLREALEVDPRVHTDPDDRVERLAAVYALAENPANLLLEEHDVVRPLQVREHAVVAEGLHNGDSRQEAERLHVLRLRLEDEGNIETSRGRGPRTAVTASSRTLALRKDHSALLRGLAQEGLRDLVRRVDGVKPHQGP